MNKFLFVLLCVLALGNNVYGQNKDQRGKIDGSSFSDNGCRGDILNFNMDNGKLFAEVKCKIGNNVFIADETGTAYNPVWAAARAECTKFIIDTSSPLTPGNYTVPVKTEKSEYNIYVNKCGLNKVNKNRKAEFFCNSDGKSIPFLNILSLQSNEERDACAFRGLDRLN